MNNQTIGFQKNHSEYHFIKKEFKNFLNDKKLGMKDSYKMSKYLLYYKKKFDKLHNKIEKNILKKYHEIIDNISFYDINMVYNLYIGFKESEKYDDIFPDIYYNHYSSDNFTFKTIWGKLPKNSTHIYKYFFYDTILLFLKMRIFLKKILRKKYLCKKLNGVKCYYCNDFLIFPIKYDHFELCPKCFFKLNFGKFKLHEYERRPKYQSYFIQFF